MISLLPNQLVPGKKYKLLMEDCCIEGELVLTFVSFDDDKYVLKFKEGSFGAFSAMDIVPAEDPSE